MEEIMQKIGQSFKKTQSEIHDKELQMELDELTLVEEIDTNIIKEYHNEIRNLDRESIMNIIENESFNKLKINDLQDLQNHEIITEEQKDNEEDENSSGSDGMI